MFSILFSESPIDFYDKNLDVLVKNLKYFLYEKYIKWFCLVLEEKYLAPLRIWYSFIKYFLNPLADIASTFFGSSFTSFSASTCFVLFQYILLLNPDSLSSKSVIFIKLAVSRLLGKLAYFNLAAKFSDVKFFDVNSGAVEYLKWSWSVIFISISLIFVL